MADIIVSAVTHLQIIINVHPRILPVQKLLSVVVNVLPSKPAFAEHKITIPYPIKINPIRVPLAQGLINAVRRLTAGKIESYFDQDRVGKTLLNFGNDYQAPLVNWKYDKSDTKQTTIVVKTYRPLPPEVTPLTKLWIVRELTPTLIDQLFITVIPGVGKQLHLRPPNRNISVRGIDGNNVSDVTFNTLLTTGSFDKVNATDPIMNEWFVTSMEGAELNIDYADFRNFVFYSSAERRITTFTKKLSVLEDLNNTIAGQSASIASATTSSLAGFTGSMAYPSLQLLVENKNNVVRSLDGYERFLYYSSGSAYSSSFSGDGGLVDQLYYLSDATWPKIAGVIAPIASASTWLTNITDIAKAYDIHNVNRLVNNLPQYLQADEHSADFITFMDMVGHHFDILKSYADAMPEIYNRDSDPSTGLSADMVWNIADSFGIELPNQYAIKKLVDYTIGAVGATNPVVYRQSAAETWKRFLHNQMYLLKTKGTATSLRGLMNAYGVLPTTIQVRETATPSFYTTQSYEVFEEQTNTLTMNNTLVTVPFSASAQTIQIRFATTTATQSVILNAGNNWALRLSPISGTYGTVQFISGSTIAASSSIFTVYSGDYYSVTLEKNNNVVGLWTQHTKNGDFVDNSYTTSSAASSGIWASGSTIYLGGSGSTYGAPFAGFIDEFRVWSEPLSASVINMHAQYPGLYNGNTSTSALNNLLIRLSFNIPKNLGTSAFLLNESPFISNPAATTQFTTSGFANVPAYPYSMTVTTRTVLRYAANVGGSQFVSNKITIADPATYRYMVSDVSGTVIPVLSHENSMVPLDKKLDDTRSNSVVGFYFSTTDAINDNIIRSIGNVNVQDYIGDPSSMFAANYSDLVTLNKFYWKNYAYQYNFNQFVSFVDTLLNALFDQAKKLVPARTKLLTGIVLESPILERNKIQYKQIDVSGYDTYNSVDTPTLYAEPTTTQPNNTDASYDDYDAIYEMAVTSPVVGDIENTSAKLILTGTNQPHAFFTDYNATYDLMQLAPIAAQYATYDDELARLNYIKFLLTRFNATSTAMVRTADQPYFTQLLTTFVPGNRVTVDTGMNGDLPDNLLVSSVNPTVDFESIGGTMYLVQSAGVYPVEIQSKVRSNASTLTSAGTWTLNGVYTSNQFVTQSNQTGSATSGNGYEYICVTPLSSGSFFSKLPPSLDIDNWRRMKYVYVPAISYVLVTLFSGSIQLVTSGSGYTPFTTGYIAQHYRFFEDRHLATLRHKRLGCKNTNYDTFDGGLSIEIIPSAGDVLVVSTGAEPIQRTTDNTGPILNIR